MESVLSDFMAFPSLTPFQASLYLFIFPCSNTSPPPPPPPPYHCQILFLKLSSTWASKKRKSPPLSKRENPLVTLERSMSTWQVDWVISPHLTVKQWLGEVDSGNIKCPKSEQPLGGGGAWWWYSTKYQNDAFTLVSKYSPHLYFLFPFFKIKNYCHFILTFQSRNNPHCYILIFEDEAVFSFWMNHFLYGLLLPLLSFSLVPFLNLRSFLTDLFFSPSTLISSAVFLLVHPHCLFFLRFAYTL